MTFRLWACILVAHLLILDARAANQVGTITASGSFKLRGVSVPGPAAQSLPLVSGDEIETQSATAIILLPDGSRVMIDKNSRLEIQQERNETILCLDQGALEFNAVAGSRLTICALGRPVHVIAPAEGAVSVEGAETVRALAKTGSVHVDENQTCQCKGQKPRLTRKKAIVLVVAAGATATGISIARARASELPDRSESTPPAP